MAPDSSPIETDTQLLGRTLFDTFGKGWAKGNVESIMSVFSAEAVFIETPYASPLKGTEEIRKYWADVPYNQSEITFSTGEVFTVGPWFSTEFHVLFRRRRTGEWIDARGAIFCELDGDRIGEMRMYWHRLNNTTKSDRPA